MSTLQAKKQEERNANILKELRNQPDNKRCMDCLAQYPQYVVLDFGTWVCASCSGLHREFNHKIKSPSMSTFKDEEVQKLQCQGNGVAKDTWRAKWSVRDFPEPEAGNISKTREFIRATYVEKRWYTPLPDFSSNKNNSESSSNNQTSSQTSSSQSQNKAKPVNNTLIDWDEPSPSPSVNVAPSQPTQSFDPFSFGTLNNALPPQTPSNQFNQNPFANPPTNNNQSANPFNNINVQPNVVQQPQQNPGFGFANFPPVQNNQGFGSPQQNQGYGNQNQGFVQNQGYGAPQNQGFTNLGSQQNQGFGNPNQNQGFTQNPFANVSFPPQQNQGFGSVPQNNGFNNQGFGSSQPNQGFGNQNQGFSQPQQPQPQSNQGFGGNPFNVPNNSAPQPNVNSQDPFSGFAPQKPPTQPNHNQGFFDSQPNPFNQPPASNSGGSMLDLDFFSAPKPAPATAPVNKPTQSQKPAPTPAQPKSDDVTANSCPICTIKFEPGMSNRDINNHIDECLNSATLEDIQNGVSPTSNQRKETGRGGNVVKKTTNHVPGVGTFETTETVEPVDWSQWFNLSRMDWYFGAIDRAEAEKTLRSCGHDSFLVRKSSVRDSYAVSFYSLKKKACSHTLIEPAPGGYKFSDTPKVYPTLIDLITNSPETSGIKPPPRVDRHEPW